MSSTLRLASAGVTASRRLAAVLGLALACIAVSAYAEEGPTWARLSAAQRQALSPLQRDWASIDASRKQKWLEVAARFPAMPADERQRVQERMAAWAALTPAERTRARMQFQESRLISPEERQARWEAYQALPEDERVALAQRAKQAARAASTAASSIPSASARPASGAGGTAVAKNNVVAPVRVQPSRPVAPTVVQAKPGVTTTTMSTRASPPAHHQPGLPKIVASPGFVDPATLLPKRGPQGAAVRAAASNDPTQQP